MYINEEMDTQRLHVCLSVCLIVDSLTLLLISELFNGVQALSLVCVFAVVASGILEKLSKEEHNYSQVCLFQYISGSRCSTNFCFHLSLITLQPPAVQNNSLTSFFFKSHFK